MVMETLSIYIVTWNVAARTPIEDFRQLLGLDSDSSTYINVPDIYIIGLQEVKSQPQNLVLDALFVDPWTSKVLQVLAPFGHVKIQTTRMQGLVLSIFMKRTHLIHLRDLDTQLARRGLMNMGNKGAIAVRLSLHGCSLCFVNCHLTPHDHLLQERIKDYKEILEGLEFSSYPETSNILFHDYVFWLGDLNFRLAWNKPSEDIVEMISNKQFSTLLVDDELGRARRSGDAFSELEEMEITFPPSYKFEFGVDNYDLKRRPGWTDRILYHVNSNVYDDANIKLSAKGSNYRSHMKYRESDHRPVTSSFEIQVFRPTHEKLIEFFDIPVWKLGENNKVFYRINPSLVTSPEDWIGIYKSDFTSLDDYVAYAYAPSISENEHEETANPREIAVVFSENSISRVGNYILIYYGAHPSKSILGIGIPFEAVLSASSLVV